MSISSIFLQKNALIHITYMHLQTLKKKTVQDISQNDIASQDVALLSLIQFTRWKYIEDISM